MIEIRKFGAGTGKMKHITELINERMGKGEHVTFISDKGSLTDLKHIIITEVGNLPDTGDLTSIELYSDTEYGVEYLIRRLHQITTLFIIDTKRHDNFEELDPDCDVIIFQQASGNTLDTDGDKIHAEIL